MAWPAGAGLWRATYGTASGPRGWQGRREPGAKRGHERRRQVVRVAKDQVVSDHDRARIGRTRPVRGIHERGLLGRRGAGLAFRPRWGARITPRLGAGQDAVEMRRQAVRWVLPQLGGVADQRD